MSGPSRIVPLGRKALELGLRQVGMAPEEVHARRLVRRSAVPAPTSGPTVLICSPRDWSAHVQWDSLIAHALVRRGASVEMATCGGGLPTCDRVNVYEGPPPPCRTCSRYTTVALQAHGFPPHLLASTWADGVPAWPELDALPLGELLELEDQGLPLGRMVGNVARWFLCNADLGSDPLGPTTVRTFLRAARAVRQAAVDLLDRTNPDVLMVVNGLFFFEFLLCAEAARRGVRVVSYERGFIQGTLFFAHGPGASRYEVGDAWPSHRERPLSPDQEERLNQYLADRRQGLHSHVSLWPTATTTADAPASGRRRFVAFTNVTWDSAVLDRDVTFPGIGDWLKAIIGQIGGRSDLELVLRIHPAEVRIRGWETRQPAKQMLDRIGALPPNISVIAPDDPTSSYSLMESCDAALVYTSTTGLELALLGKPVMVAGDTHYRGKGFTIDPEDPDAYAAAVEDVIADPSLHRPDIDLARRYANLFFFEAPVGQPPSTEPVPGLVRLDLTSLDELGPGRHPGLDRICAGILTGAPFFS